MNKLNTLLLVSALTASPLALADHDGMGDHSERHGGYFSEADTNKDGSIDKTEAQAMHDKHFAEMDKNRDGKISKEEMASYRHDHMRGAMHDKGTLGFGKADKNGDGKLTKDEAKSLPNVSRNFDAIDVDKDGTVERDEIHNFMKSQQH